MSDQRRVVISGASGLIGARTCAHLAERDWRIQRLVRRDVETPDAEIAWQPAAGEIDTAALEGADAVVHLAGKNIVAKRWTPEFKEAIRESRVNGTRTIAEALAALASPPDVLVSASAVGYYGDRGEDVLTEESDPGEGFLAGVCREWEAAAAAASDAGIRVVLLRIAVVLAGDGGALATMLRPFKLGVGGPLGSGKQYMSWVHIDDLARIIEFAIEGDLAGPVNATSPAPETNAEFTRSLGRTLRRPAFMRMPEFAVAAAFGEMGREMLLASGNVHPAKLEAAGFEFHHPQLEAALEALLRKEAPG